MDLYEHQGKDLLRSHGVPVPAGAVATTPSAASAAAAALGFPATVDAVAVKAQVRTGGRGKAGGIRLVRSPGEVAPVAAELLAMEIRGEAVASVLVEEAVELAGECYLSVVLDRAGRGYLLLVSTEGGVDVEEVARRRPDAVLRVGLDPRSAIDAGGIATAMTGLDLAEPVLRSVAALAARLVEVFVAADAELVEINPVGIGVTGAVSALDAKVTLDASARFRHPEWAAWDGADFRDDRERRAKQRGLNYVGLDGDVGVIGNGAGLVLATLDVVARCGGRPANFLDIGGGASAAVMSAALAVVDSDPAVRAILVNIFGGITRGEEVAHGILDALARVRLTNPLVLRLDGTNAEEGLAILGPHLSDRLQTDPSMDGAAALAVGLAAGAAGR